MQQPGNALFFIVSVMMIGSCSQNTAHMKEELTSCYNDFRFQEALQLIDSMEDAGEKSYKVDSMADYIQRYYKEYPYTEEDVQDQIRERGVTVNGDQMAQWEEEGHLEFKVIDGEKRYFKNAVYNLFLLEDSLRELSGSEGLNEDSLNRFCVDHIRRVLTELDSGGIPGKLHPAEMILNYQVKVDSGAVPPGAEIAAWLPFGVRNHDSRKSVKLVRSRPESSKISPADCAHQSLYLEQSMPEVGSAVFSSMISLTTHARYVEPHILEKVRFGELPDSVHAYAGERGPHILFTDEVRHLADSLVTQDMSPYEMVKQFYFWVNDHIPWASAVEYGLMDNIPLYTLEHGHGDCGMQTLLFMTLCRYKGIPARWQSGWMLHPGHVNLHDWCEVWYEDVGWVPVDVSFKLQKSDDPRVREFYITGIDAFRFVVNKDYGREFCPEKQWPRSEPWDFQRGELEWAGGNLYFDLWSWDMEVKYIR
ncbi:MAG: transglutaminase-like domain-containing protein [Marinilabilia sp.]